MASFGQIIHSFNIYWLRIHITLWQLLGIQKEHKKVVKYNLEFSGDKIFKVIIIPSKTIWIVINMEENYSMLSEYTSISRRMDLNCKVRKGFWEKVTFHLRCEEWRGASKARRYRSCPGKMQFWVWQNLHHGKSWSGRVVGNGANPEGLLPWAHGLPLKGFKQRWSDHLDFSVVDELECDHSGRQETSLLKESLKTLETEFTFHTFFV